MSVRANETAPREAKETSLQGKCADRVSDRFPQSWLNGVSHGLGDCVETYDFGAVVGVVDEVEFNSSAPGSSILVPGPS